MNKQLIRGSQGTYFPIVIEDVKVINSKDIRMGIQIDFDIYQQVKKQRLFNLFEDKIEPSSFTKFSSTRPIEIELKLDPTLIEVLELAIKLEAEIIKDYVISKSGEGSDNLFIYHDSWFLLTAVQEESLPEELAKLGSIKTGFQTTWRKEL